jgi:hypothetical protein
MGRKVWFTNCLLDDLLIEHFHPGAECCPMDGFGMLPSDPELIKRSQEAVERLTGRTYKDLTDEQIAAIMAKK